MTRTPEEAAGAPAAAVARLTEKFCDTTYDLSAGNLSGSGFFVVNVYPEAGRNEDLAGLPTAALLRPFIDGNLDLLSTGGHNVHSWCVSDGDDCHVAGKNLVCHLSIARVVPTLIEAQRLAVACNQPAITWLKQDGVHILDNQGHGYGDGKKLTGPGLEACRKARDGSP